MGFIKVGAVLFASLLVGMANASNGNKNNNNKTENKMTVTELTQEDFVKKVYDFETNPNAWKFRVINLRLSISMPLGVALVR